ncbi:MAG: hypothetical protein L7T26_11275, partial [Pseudomonadales bacterium]|nr:hypothetical protein [Pseudomonadales bacterium]
DQDSDFTSELKIRWLRQYTPNERVLLPKSGHSSALQHRSKWALGLSRSRGNGAFGGRFTS